MSTLNPSAPAPVEELWVVGGCDEAGERRLMDELGVPKIVARILCQRGFGELEKAERFLRPRYEDFHDPSLLPDYDAAVAAILGAKERGELIYIHGDYDVDGVSSSAIFQRFLSAIGCRVHTQIPHRRNDGYGLNLNAVNEAKSLGAGLLLTCDCGIGALDEVRYANSLGLKVVITDHHEVGPELPEVVAVVNPHRKDSRYPFAALSGAGVVFKLCEGICRELRLQLGEYYRRYLDLAVLGTIADVMPLRDENRLIARFGLEHLSQSRKKGLQHLMRVAGIREGDRLKAGKISFQIGPRLNAVGRIDDAEIAFRLLVTKDDDEAENLARHTDELNLRRRSEQERMITEAIARVEGEGLHEHKVIFLADESWHAGIVGIVAGKLVDRYGRPSFVGTVCDDGRGKASARSIAAFNVAEAIRALPHLLSGGGHAAAAGCAFDFAHIADIRRELNRYADSMLSVEDFAPVVNIDAELDAEDVTLDSLDALAHVEPFGCANPEPTFLARNVTLTGVRPFTKPYQARVNFRTETGTMREGVTWSAGEQFAEMGAGTKLDVIYRAEINEFNRSRTPRWKVEAYAPAGSQRIETS